MAKALEKNRTSLEQSFSVSRWRVSPDSADPADVPGRDPLAPDWWIDDTDASQSSLTAMGMDLAALDAAILAAARAEKDGA